MNEMQLGKLKNLKLVDGFMGVHYTIMYNFVLCLTFSIIK